MWCETINNFLANHGILMERFLQDMVLTCALITFCVGMFLGWLVVEIRDGITWRAYTPWPKTKTKPPMWFDGKK